MRKFSTFLILLSYALLCFADPIDKNAARKIAEDFYKQQESSNDRRRSTKQPEFQLDYICKDDSKANKRAKGKSSDNNLYYVFNADKNQGFVIVSGDDKAGEVLAYSSSGNFSHSDMPENLEQWMNNYKDAIKTIVNDEVSFDRRRSKTATTTSHYAPEILPLLEKEGIRWGQREPYNRLSPEHEGIKTPSGCVATAISQIMRYHKHPKKTQGGSKKYTSRRGITLTANFNTTYDWNSILPKYNGRYNDKQAKEVAKLLYNVGVSVEMNYGNRGSGTPTGMAKEALVKYFAYDKGIDFISRKHYRKDEWISILKKELNEQRPVVYDGLSKDGGHAFVCDGYDSNNLFHINWGWNGMSDGYFELSILEPYSQGTGGSTRGYTFGQGMLIGIQPEKANSTSTTTYHISFDDLKLPEGKLNKSEPFDIIFINMANISHIDYNKFAFRLTLESEAMDYYNLFEVKKPFTLKSGRSQPEVDLEDLRLPENTPNGTYKLLLQSKNPDSGKYITALTQNESFKEVTVIVDDTNIEFKYKKLEPKLEVVGSPRIKNGQLYPNKDGEISIDFRNNGQAAFCSKIAVRLVPTNQEEPFEEVITRIEAGESKTLNFRGHVGVPEGNYNLEVRCVSPNSEDRKGIPNVPLYEEKIRVSNVTVKPTVLELFCNRSANAPTALRYGSENQEREIELNFSITSNGLRYEGDIQLQLVDQAGRVHYSKTENATINAQAYQFWFKENENTRKLLPGTYSVRLLYKKDGRNFAPIQGNYSNLKIIIGQEKLALQSKELKLEVKQNENLAYAPQILNTGGAYKGKVSLDIIPSRELRQKGQGTVTLNTELTAHRRGQGVARFNENLDAGRFQAGSYTTQLKYSSGNGFKKIGQQGALTIVSVAPVGPVEPKAPKLQYSNLQYEEVVEAGSKLKVSFDVVNNGTATFSGEVGAAIFKQESTGGYKAQSYQPKSISLKPRSKQRVSLELATEGLPDSKSLATQLGLPATDCYLFRIVQDDRIVISINRTKDFKFEILAKAPVGPTAPQLVYSNIKYEKEVEAGSPLSVSFDVENNGGATFSGEVGPAIFKRESTGYKVQPYYPKSISLKPHSKQKVSFELATEDLPDSKSLATQLGVPATDCYIFKIVQDDRMVISINGTKDFKFEILANSSGGSTGIPSITAAKASLKIQQHADNLVIKLPQSSETLYIYDLNGRLVSKSKLTENQADFSYSTTMLNSQIYLIVVEGKFGKIVEKVLLK